MFVLGQGVTKAYGPFDRRGEISGGQFEGISDSDKEYRLSSDASRRFVRFWRGTTKLFQEEAHYLIPPARRFGAAGTRSEREDALVDYVVGLEALLGKPNERTELNFRFKTRGAVVLAASMEGRRHEMKMLDRLYDLRSRIVHGQAVSADALNSAIPDAERALRSIWHWFFRRYPKSPDNSEGVDRIDELLVGSR